MGKRLTKLEFTKQFVKQFKKLDYNSQNAITNTLEQIKKDLTYKSLRVKKMKGYHNPDVWEASASMGLRLTFEIQKPNRIVLRNCGTHDILRNP